MAKCTWILDSGMAHLTFYVQDSVKTLLEDAFFEPSLEWFTNPRTAGKGDLKLMKRPIVTGSNHANFKSSEDLFILPIANLEAKYVCKSKADGGATGEVLLLNDRAQTTNGANMMIPTATI